MFSGAFTVVSYPPSSLVLLPGHPAKCYVPWLPLEVTACDKLADETCPDRLQVILRD